MKIQCPSCGMQLKAGEKFIQKIENLAAGEKARVKCTSCSEPYAVGKDSLESRVTGVKPPCAPDISWLKAGDADGFDEIAEELPTVLVLMQPNVRREAVANDFGTHGYRVEYAANSTEAIEKMQFYIYAAVVQDASYEPGSVQGTAIHRFISAMDMAKRRQMLYILIGDDFRTLYDLEALCYSANLVVNTKEINHFPTMLRKLVRENEILFGPLIAEMQAAGR